MECSRFSTFLASCLPAAEIPPTASSPSTNITFMRVKPSTPTKTMANFILGENEEANYTQTNLNDISESGKKEFNQNPNPGLSNTNLHIHNLFNIPVNKYFELCFCPLVNTLSEY